MIRFVRRAAMLGSAVVAAALGAQAASATTFMFTGSDKAATSGNALTYSSTDGSGLGLSVYGGHLGSTVYGSYAKSTGATAETYTNYGLGVLYGSDTENNGTHQIDNAGGGVDYVALVFNQAVSLSQIGLEAYGGSGVGTGVDAQFAAFSGSVSSLLSGNNYLNENIFSTPASSATGTRYIGNQRVSYTVDSTGTSAASNIWLVAANVGQSNDGFKLLGISVADIPGCGSVPEPASWALMIVGFGAVGGSLRRRRNTDLAVA